MPLPTAMPMPSDPLCAVTHPDPAPYYRILAAQRPFYRDEALGLWVASGAAEVQAVLAHPACRVRPPAQAVPPALAGSPAGTLFGGLIRMNDGDWHAPLKGVLRKRMACLALAGMGARVLALAQDLPFDAVRPGAAVNHWMFTLPVLAVADALGLPMTGKPSVAGQVVAFARAMSPLATAQEIAAGSEAATWLQAWMRASLSSAPPLDALVHEALAAGVAREIIAANAIGLLIQACEATAGLVGNMLLCLGRDTSHGRERPALDCVAARVLREDPPVQNTRRFLAADVRLCGAQLQAGDTVLVVLAAASLGQREAATPAPWTFGRGHHACPGDALASTVAQAVVAALLARGADPASLAHAFRYRPSVNARIPYFL
ncbi:cytochrome P450 [Cupriavidus basilensis]|uniref:Putative cytochrome p450 oxidoreductase n=1 Tax=Cupriavidus basilensis TaxID=68895 RepID=A0A0C4YSM5_9BURK|nr:cytochrome P450 [Cupriavidus basilensis]AJG24939.1 putative cytochrome p450 oxidoreductase [Cupriavidus basilensis]